MGVEGGSCAPSDALISGLMVQWDKIAARRSGLLSLGEPIFGSMVW
jgi:hypothetical protein